MEQTKQQEYWHGKEYAYFCHRRCEAFPCHKGIAEEEFNCLFCYCPLYALGSKCGGAFRYTENGIKDCSLCTFPHRRDNYGKIMERYSDIAALAAKDVKNP